MMMMMMMMIIIIIIIIIMSLRTYISIAAFKTSNISGFHSVTISIVY